MLTQFRPAIILLILFTVVTGLIYPAVVTGIAQLTMPAKANGSLIESGGKAVGSTLIGQPFSDPKYFWSRPSATAPYPYNASASSGSNLGPTNPALADAVSARVKAIASRGSRQPGAGARRPGDRLGKRSGSRHQPGGGRIPGRPRGQSRGMEPAKIRALVEQATDGRQLGFLGEPVVNVLELNLALDAASRDPAP